MAMAQIALTGSPDEPGSELAVVDLVTRSVRSRVGVGLSPVGLALHPDGDVLAVLNRFSNFLSLVDTASDREVARIEVEYYASEAAWSPEGDRLYVTNRWRDSVQVLGLVREGRGWAVTERVEPGVPVGSNPRDLALSDDGRTLVVGSVTGTTVSFVDTDTLTETHRVELGAPGNDVAIVDGRVVVATLSASTHHQPESGPDGDGDGSPGDGTPNINFQDLQNELAVLDLDSGELLWRGTSDTLCCRDYRDVDPDDLDRLGDTLPPVDTWVVGGALPEQLDVGPDGRIWVSYSGSSEFQAFELDPDSGVLTPGPVHGTTGHNPHGLVATDEGVVVVHRLGETLGIYGPDGAAQDTVEVGDLTGGAFPATDAEIGELFNFVTASFTVDGDQTCAHCHREGGNVDKAFSMPLTAAAGLGTRMTMDYRGAADTRPWFFETAMDQHNFKPVINEFARIENFCCTDYTLWPDGAPADCEENPPPECASEPNAGSFDGANATRDSDYLHDRPTPWATRDLFYEEASLALLGRRESFGDAVYYEDLITEERSPIALNLDGITRALGMFLMADTHLLPNPFAPDAGAVARGEALFNSPETACSTCHPAPTFAVSTDVNPSELPLRMGPVVTPFVAEDGTNLDLYSQGFIDTFPLSDQDSCEAICGEEACAEDPTVCDDLRQVYLGVPSLRGIWDRAPSMLHHGRAQGLREVLATPGHPGLRPGETGFNERHGVPDTHGATSHLTADELDDLVAFLETL